jgi:hypothetical protein
MVLSLLITALALIDGYIHLRLSGLLFGGPSDGSPALGSLPTVDAMAELPLPLNQLLLMNGIGFLVLTVLLWLGPAIFGRRRWLIDLVLIGYAAVNMVGWYFVGMPNPMNLGYISKAVEIVLVLALLLHIRSITTRVPWRP